MTEIALKIVNQVIRLPETLPRLVAGSAGVYAVTLAYDDQWDNATVRVVVFDGGLCNSRVSVQDTTGTVTIPAECIAHGGRGNWLQIGVLGYDGTGALRITTRAMLDGLRIDPAGVSDADVPQDPPTATPGLWEQLVADVGNLSDLQTADTSSLVAAINELAANATAYINTMQPASADEDGLQGLVPAPAAGDEGKFLRGDGTWRPIETRVDTTLTEYGVPADAATTGSRFAAIPDLTKGTGEQVACTAEHPSGSDGVSYVKVSDATPEFWELVGGNVDGYRLGGIAPGGITISGTDYMELTDEAYGISCSTKGRENPGIAMCVIATGATIIHPDPWGSSPDVEIPEAGIYLGSYRVGGRLYFEIRQLTYTANRKVAQPYLPSMSRLVLDVDWDDDGNPTTSTTAEEFLAAMNSGGVVIRIANVLYNLCALNPDDNVFIFAQTEPFGTYSCFEEIHVLVEDDKLKLWWGDRMEQLSSQATRQLDAKALAGGALTTPGNIITADFSSDDPTVTVGALRLYKISEDVFPYQEFIGQHYDAIYTYNGEDVALKGTFLPYANQDWREDEGWALSDSGITTYLAIPDSSYLGVIPGDPVPIISIFAEGNVIGAPPGVYALASIRKNDTPGSISISYLHGRKLLDYYIPEASLFWVTLSFDDDGAAKIDKTWDEILDAFRAHQIPICTSLGDDGQYGYKGRPFYYQGAYESPYQEYLRFVSRDTSASTTVTINKRGNVTYETQQYLMQGCTEDLPGTSGLVPQPVTPGTFLASSGMWEEIKPDYSWRKIYVLDTSHSAAIITRDYNNEHFELDEVLIVIRNPQFGANQLYINNRDTGLYNYNLALTIPDGVPSLIHLAVYDDKFGIVSTWGVGGQIGCDKLSINNSSDLDKIEALSFGVSSYTEVLPTIEVYGRP